MVRQFYYIVANQSPISLSHWLAANTAITHAPRLMRALFAAGKSLGNCRLAATRMSVLKAMQKECFPLLCYTCIPHTQIRETKG